MSKKTKIKFENWAQYTRDARTYIPAALDYDETWSQATLAAVLGVNPNYISMIERGKKRPGKQYRVTFSYIIGMADMRVDPRSAIGLRDSEEVV